MPTNISKQAIVTKNARPVEVTLALKRATLVAGTARQVAQHLPGRSVSEGPTWRAPEATASSSTASWVVRCEGAMPRAEIVARSPKAGVARESCDLG